MAVHHGGKVGKATKTLANHKAAKRRIVCSGKCFAKIDFVNDGAMTLLTTYNFQISRLISF